MAEAIKDTADITYSGRKTDADKNTAYTGKVFTFDKVLEKVNLTSKWEAAPDATSVLFWNDASYNAELEKSAVKETRNAYKDDGTVASSVPVGFMQAEKKGKVYFQLVYGQTSFEDENASNFVKFDAKGNTKIKISTPGLKVYWNDTNVGTVSYETMVDSVSQATKTKKYSAINRKGTYDGNIEGYVYEFSRLLKSVGVADEWASAPDQTKVFLEEYGEDGKQSVLSKKNLTEPRYYFANDADKTRGERVDPGFMDNGDEGFQFVYGQTKADDVNKSAFVSFAGVTNGTVKIYTPYEIVDQDGKVSYFHYEDLEDLWIAEGSKEYNYTCINTYPTFSTESFRGPTLKAVLNQAGIDLDSLSDTDVIRFDSSDGQGLDFTVKDIKATRYAFPNGESKNKFKGTTEAQLKDKVEVPYILSMNGRSNIRNIFGQIDPQEQQKSSHIKYITKITVKKDAAKDFEGTTPTIENNGKYYKGEKLIGVFNFGSDRKIVSIDELGNFHDLLTGNVVLKDKIALMPGDFVWMLCDFRKELSEGLRFRIDDFLDREKETAGNFATETQKQLVKFYEDLSKVLSHSGFWCTSKVFAWLLGIFGFCLFVTFMTIALLIAGNLQFRVY